jgi:hypothetical protein
MISTNGEKLTANLSGTNASILGCRPRQAVPYIFLQGGGDIFTVFASGTNPVVGPVDLEAIVSYATTNLNHQIIAVIENRITVVP